MTLEEILDAHKNATKLQSFLRTQALEVLKETIQEIANKGFQIIIDDDDCGPEFIIRPENPEIFEEVKKAYLSYFDEFPYSSYYFVFKPQNT